MKSEKKHWILILFMIAIAAGSRFIPHWHNFTAVGAMGLFGAAYLTSKYWSFIIPLLALWFSDLILNNVVYAAYQDGFVWFTDYAIFVYLGFAGIVVIGHILLKKVTIVNILGASLLASIVFFLISNFGSFLLDPMYPKNAGGLGAAYLAGVPFFWNGLLANVVYSFLLIGGFELVTRTLPVLARTRSTP